MTDTLTTPLPSTPSSSSSSSSLSSSSAGVAGAGAAGAGAGVALANSNPLARKLAKQLGAQLDQNKQAVAGLRALSTFVEDNTLHTRRNLRSAIEAQALSVHRELAASLGQVDAALDAAAQEVALMAACCSQMTDRLNAATSKTATLLEVTNKLNSESARVELRSEVIARFLQRFQLTAAETAALSSSSAGSGAGSGSAGAAAAVPVVNEALFSALARVREIHAECKILVHSTHQRAGLEIMEQMSLLLESGYEKLFRWTQHACKQLSKDLAEVTPNLRSAFVALSDRSVLFQYCIDELASSRRVAVQRMFIDALTRGGPGGTPRPIELHSHDPMRYVGDMLAWLHQTVASEREFLDSLLLPPRLAARGRTQRSGASAPLASRSGSLPDADQGQRDSQEQKRLELSKIIQKTLDQVMEATCRPLKARADQVLLSQPGIVVCFKLTSLLQFYGDTIKQLMPEENALCAIIQGLRQLAIKVLLDALSIHARKLLSSGETPNADLTPPHSFVTTLTMMRDILASHDASLVVSDAARQAEFSTILAQLVDPLLQFSVLSAAPLESSARPVFILNCLYALQTTLSLYETTQSHILEVDKQINVHSAAIVNEAATSVLVRSEMAGKLAMMRTADPTVPLSSIPSMDALSMRTVLLQFDRLIASPDVISAALAGSEKIASPRLQSAIHAQVAGLLMAAYDSIYEAVADPRNGYGAVDTIAHRTPAQIKLLLGS
ncbi:hypothetical protein CAOG_07248 [Capsaspora owczarzaki ATCC 30864]|uniref:Conserved oligomeric Golgi complex subunit 6 n=1 Tax=Capsaspora owczarzaki (strain ATCC 30864) TaxID=595528 RepID=A0A0D2VZS5_CAPO3|nr:hypothetical protein CAOG_07248 [Capsaspora owczarzaki ATCC 30864]KJE97377.1 hypothetical protein CAOG_007248 [Capsaspora owczarzaki ATCC 30864]|eukprot:XP_004343107.1 hypothetical protein CAOG_07248 [Capsaspora owczarzaki ATCC 30864]